LGGDIPALNRTTNLGRLSPLRWWTQSPRSLPSLFLPAPPSFPLSSLLSFRFPPLLPLEAGPLDTARGSGDHCKLPQCGLGRCHSRRSIWCIFEPKRAALVAIFLWIFPKINQLTLTVFGRPFVKRFALCYRSVVCPVCLSLTFVHALWPNGWTDQDETWHAGRPRP